MIRIIAWRRRICGGDTRKVVWMGLHRNSQKRLYVADGIYFITTNTYERYPYFKNEVLCELFLETLDFTSLIKEFKLHGLAINPEHIHLLIQPTGKYNYSEIMGTLKRNFARDCNDLISGRNFRRDNEDIDANQYVTGTISKKYMDIRSNRYFQEHLSRLSGLQAKYFANNHKDGAMVRFRWQSSFRDHLVRDENDYINHLEYIMKQPIKHRLPGRKWYWIRMLAERIKRYIPNHQFQFIIASSEYIFRKPHKRIFELALRKAGLEAGDVWYCGDNAVFDVDGAAGCGIFPVWYKGAIKESNKHGPKSEHLEVSDWDELIEILDKA